MKAGVAVCGVRQTYTRDKPVSSTTNPVTHSVRHIPLFPSAHTETMKGLVSGLMQAPDPTLEWLMWPVAEDRLHGQYVHISPSLFPFNILPGHQPR